MKKNLLEFFYSIVDFILAMKNKISIAFTYLF